MNHREPPHLPAGMRRALRCLTLLSLPVVAPFGAHALPRSLPLGATTSGRGDPTPYLLVIGAPPLRVQDAPVVPAPVVRLTAAATPVASPTPIETSPPTPDSTSVPSVTPAASETEVARADPSLADPAPPTKSPAPILPDNARPVVRPEDFLPYFQLPGSTRHFPDVTLLVPVPPSAPNPAGTLPPSSATYTQTPK